MRPTKLTAILGLRKKLTTEYTEAAEITEQSIVFQLLSCVQRIPWFVLFLNRELLPNLPDSGQSIAIREFSRISMQFPDYVEAP
ncbi:MAG: hypothetical protein KIT57_11865 [Blastocatellales bacterium]|nr:hypothetical protein [Blastocatellales bacterium]